MARPSNDPEAALAAIRQKLNQARLNRPAPPTTDCDSSSSDSCDVVDQFREYEHEVSRENELVPALAMRCYHLPGYTYWGDWVQYFRNNHPVLGLCCHHVQHPIRARLRLLHLTGSLVFGLAATNIIWLYFFYDGSDIRQPVISINVRGFGSSETSPTDVDAGNATPAGVAAYDSASVGHFDITQGMVVLWTFGALLHAIFDNTVWYMTACVCCLSSSRVDTYRKWGTYCIVVAVLLITAVATLALVVRTSAEVLSNTPYHDDDVTNPDLSLHEASMYKLLISYVIEFSISLFIYYPMIATILFSGILGCGSVPVLGGRPYEVTLEAKRRAREERSSGLDMLPFELPKLPDSIDGSPRTTRR
jgi:hypothetical protein